MHTEYKINKNQMRHLIVSSLLIIGLVLVQFVIEASNIDFNTSINISLVFAIGIYAYIIAFNYLLISRINLYLIFIILSFPFLYGRHVLHLLNMAPDGANLFKTVISESAYITTSFFCIQCILCVNIGYLLVKNKKMSFSEIREFSINTTDQGDKYLYMIGFIVMAISAVPFIKEQGNAIQTTLLYGYGYRIIEGSKESASLNSIVSAAFLPAIIAMFLSKKKKDVLPTILLVIYFTLYMLAGSRINTFCYISLFLYYYMINTKKKIKYYKLAPFIIIFVVIFPIVSSMRGTANFSLSAESFGAALDSIWNNNLLASIFYETGNTFIATAGVIDFCPRYFPHLGGMSYICAFIYILPNAFTGGFTKQYTFTDEAVSKYLVSYGGVGSSFAAEAYYNFGYLGAFLILILIGTLWGQVSKQYENAFLEHNVYKLFLYTQIYIVIIFMIRSDLVYRIRGLVWYTIPILILAYSCKKVLTRSNR